jgi:hypothetical protein
MAASLDGALDLTPEAIRRVLMLIERPPAPTPELIRLLRRVPAQREVE